MKILIIEDETDLAQSIAEYLGKEGYLCEHVTNCNEAIIKINEYSYDCILLDLMLPGGDGLEILKEIKKLKKQDGVIIISAKDGLKDKIKGLQIGADDYLTKPFHLSELSVRIHSLIRRRQFASNNIIKINELEVDMLAKKAVINQKTLDLTKTEYDLLLFLIGNKNRIISKRALAEHLSGDMADMMDNHNFVYAHVKNLRKKLTDAGCSEYIETVYSMGYKWET